MPFNIQEIRRGQLDIGEQNEVDLNFVDTELRSQTALRAVPLELQDLTVESNFDVQRVIELVGSYYGLDGAEGLRLSHVVQTDLTIQYHLRQYLNDIITDNVLIIDTLKSSGKIVRFRGSLDIDRGYPTTHDISSDAAFQQVIAYATAEGVLLQGDEDYQAESKYSVVGNISQLELVWAIRVINRNGDSLGDYLVDGGGRVYPDVHVSYSQFRLCDGRGTTSTVACDDVPIVLDENGVCAGGIYGTCTGAAGDAYYAAKATEEMLEDVLGGSLDLGVPNSTNGGMVDIMVVDDSHPLLSGGLTAGYAHGSSPGVATILVRISSATDAGAPAHEIGHAAQATFSPNTYYLPKGSMTTNQKVEHEAVEEFIGEMVELAKRNYNGPSASPKFDSSPTWTSRYGVSYASPFEYSDMDMVDGPDEPYENARVGGYVMYQLVNELGYEEALRAFAGAVNNLADDNTSNAVSWQEFRNAMTFWATLNGGGDLLNEIRDAWYEVGVGDSSTGGHNPPTDYDPGSPPKPTVTVSLVSNCDLGQTWYDLNVTSTGASSYKLFGSPTSGGPFTYAGSSVVNPVPIFNTQDVYASVQACDNNACSLLSNPVFLSYNCPAP